MSLEGMSLVSEAGQLYIGGLVALDNPDILQEQGITHILSVLEFDYCDYEGFDCYEKMLVIAEDDPQQDLLQHFSDTNLFIQDALAGEGAVLVHCATGQSRSATIVCAYLMWAHRLPMEDALAFLQEYHPEALPNEGFIRQLEAYGRMLTDDEEAEDDEDEWRTSLSIIHEERDDHHQDALISSRPEGIFL